VTPPAGIEEAKKRDHRNVGVQQDLFFFHHLSPGSAFFLPHGGRIYNTLIDLMREKYWEYEYEEVRGGAQHDITRLCTAQQGTAWYDVSAWGGEAWRHTA
jgi:hypothetical protein